MKTIKANRNLSKIIVLSLIIVLQFIIPTESYLQFTLIRKQQANQLQGKDNCITKQNNKQSTHSLQQYDELCYFKDIAYYIQLFHNKQDYHISIDLTSPFSWLKSTQCTIYETGEPCHFMSNNKQTKKIFKKHSWGKKVYNDNDQKKQQKNNQNDEKIARIEGSNQLVQGYLQENKQIQFWTKDSGRLSRLMDILMLGFYLLQQKQKVNLHKTNFINVTKLSQNMDRLCDGVFSLRFDQNSENSLLSQIFQYTQTQDKIITIYLNGKQSTLTIGELSIKNSAEGYSGIVWVPFNQNSQETAYGRLPLVTDIMLESLAQDREEDLQKDQDNNIFAVLSLSASYIGLPQKAMNAIINQFNMKHSLKCQISKHSFLECNNAHSKKMEQVSENLLIMMKQGSISIPFESLILKQTKNKIIFNLRIISREQNQKQKSFIILGQPYFNKYFTVLDYKANRLGFGIKRTIEHNNFINTVSLIRFVSLLFFTGCCFLICFSPLKRMFEAFKIKSAKYVANKSPEGRRLKYEPIQENPYEQIAGTLRKVMEQSEQITE